MQRNSPPLLGCMSLDVARDRISSSATTSSRFGGSSRYGRGPSRMRALHPNRPKMWVRAAGSGRFWEPQWALLLSRMVSLPDRIPAIGLQPTLVLSHLSQYPFGEAFNHPPRAIATPI